MASADVEYRCFVGGLAWATDSDALEKAFSQYGEVIDSKIINDRETGRSRGFGFVTFADEKSMRDAIEGMNGQDMNGRNITVNEAQSRGSGGGGIVLMVVEMTVVTPVEVVVVETGRLEFNGL
ncbi:unnamed protein product [Trifolium pratense]|uniref:Uncharacterized protein n=1 Tax=Trifolium pratense TaxID=57577 RepID=A0ACB0MBH7_TRIPR|nr:unnamed protein product [Trifolium pratense]